MIPKLKAWDKITNQMRGCYGFNELKQEVYVCSVADNEFNGQLQTVHALTRSFDEVVIMQSTGLKDKNNIEVFEGDIVTLKYPRDRRYKVVAKVINGQDISAMVLKFGNDFNTEEFPLYKISAENNLEIIGSIYENPELLEEVASND